MVLVLPYKIFSNQGIFLTKTENRRPKNVSLLELIDNAVVNRRNVAIFYFAVSYKVCDSTFYI